MARRLPCGSRLAADAAERERLVVQVLEEVGLDPEKAWAEFEAATDRLRNGEKQYLTWEDVDG